MILSQLIQQENPGLSKYGSGSRLFKNTDPDPQSWRKISMAVKICLDN
jgi:hypothetical protein